MTIEELGRQVKTKYPGSYDNVPDLDLGNKILEKYPAYQSQVTEQAKPLMNTREEVEAATPQQPGFFKQLGQELIAPFKQLKKTSATTPKGMAKEGALIALLGPLLGRALSAPKGERLKTAGATAEVASYMLPGVGELKGLSVAAKVAKLAKAGAVAGGVFTGSGAVRRGETNPVEITKETATGTVAGGILSPILAGTTSVIKKMAFNKAARLYDAILGTTKGEQKELIRSGVKTTGQKITEQGGLPGFAKTKQGIYHASQKGIDEAETAMQPVLQGIKKTFGYDDIAKPLENLKNQLSGIPGEETAAAQIDRVLATTKQRFAGNKLTATELNNLKRELYKSIGKAFEKPEAERAITTQAQSELARGIREALEIADPTKKLGQINAEQGLHLEIRKKITDAIAKGEVKNVQDVTRILGSFFSTGNVIRRGAEAGVGALLGGVPGAFVLPAAEMITRTTPVVSGRAKYAATVAIKKLPSVVQNLIKLIGVKAGSQLTKPKSD